MGQEGSPAPQEAEGGPRGPGPKRHPLSQRLMSWAAPPSSRPLRWVLQKSLCFLHEGESLLTSVLPYLPTPLVISHCKEETGPGTSPHCRNQKAPTRMWAVSPPLRCTAYSSGQVPGPVMVRATSCLLVRRCPKPSAQKGPGWEVGGRACWGIGPFCRVYSVCLVVGDRLLKHPPSDIRQGEVVRGTLMQWEVVSLPEMQACSGVERLCPSNIRSRAGMPKWHYHGQV